MSITTVLINDYHDYAGIHSMNYRIRETMVVSHTDTLLPNSTTKSMENFLFSNNSFVGIDSSTSPQQLLFLLSVSEEQMSTNFTSMNSTNNTNNNTNLTNGTNGTNWINTTN